MTQRPKRPRQDAACASTGVRADQVDGDVEHAAVGELTDRATTSPSSGSRATSAPSASARSRALGSGSKARIGRRADEPGDLHGVDAEAADPPQADASPARSPAREVRAAYGVDTASARTAACSNGMPSGTGLSAP